MLIRRQAVEQINLGDTLFVDQLRGQPQILRWNRLRLSPRIHRRTRHIRQSALRHQRYHRRAIDPFKPHHGRDIPDFFQPVQFHL